MSIAKIFLGLITLAVAEYLLLCVLYQPSKGPIDMLDCTPTQIYNQLGEKTTIELDKCTYRFTLSNTEQNIQLEETQSPSFLQKGWYLLTNKKEQHQEQLLDLLQSNCTT